MKKVSVIIPTYNRADKIERAIKSVLDQTFEDFDVIVVDDCSSDNTEAVVKTITDERVKYHRLDKNQGAAGARNSGVAISESEYIAFHDSDDEWLPDKLKKQFEYMQEHPQVGMVYGKMHIVQSDLEGDFPNDSIEGKLEGEIYTDLLKRNTIGTPTMFLKRDEFEKVGGFDTNLRCLEDWDFAIRFSKENKIGYINEPLMIVYSEPGGVSSNIGAYYETRCKIISENRDTMQKMGIFDDIVLDLFNRAQASGVLNQVQAMLMSYLAR